MNRFTKVAVTVACGTLLAAAGAQAEVREQNFRWTTANPVGHPIPMGGQKFADLVAQKSGGNTTPP